jgi:bifunctional DNase/RNase
MINVHLSRVVLRSGTDHQYIYLSELNGKRVFPIMIGNSEANEIHRVVHDQDASRPLTHQLTHDLIVSLGGTIKHVDITGLRENTFFASIAILTSEQKEVHLDARPSDAIALALRSRAPLRVADEVFELADDME